MASKPLAPLVTSRMPTGHELAEALKEHLEPVTMIFFRPVTAEGLHGYKRAKPANP